jgi:hypothetical protein
MGRVYHRSDYLEVISFVGAAVVTHGEIRLKRRWR